MNKKIFVLIALILILASAIVNAELSVQGTSSVIDINQTRTSLYLKLDDSSPNEVLKQTDNNITILINHYNNYTFANNVTLMTCLYKTQLIRNNYDVDGNLLNLTIETETIVYNNSATSLKYYQLREQDSLQADLDCFYDRDIDDTLFQYISFGIMGLGAESYSYVCGTCARQDYEEIVTDYMNAQKTTENYLDVFLKSTNFTTNITEFWLVIYWVIKIFLLLLLVGIVFYVAIWFYNWINKLAQQI